MNKFRCGLIGCGDIGSKYAQLLSTYEVGMQLHCVYDIESSLARAISEKYSVHIAYTLDEMLSNPLDVICICSPNSTHAPLAAAALKAGTNVILEHPVALNMQEANDLLENARILSSQLFVVRQRRFLRSIQMVKSLMESRQIGDIRYFEARMLWSRNHQYFSSKPWRADPKSGGILVNQASHFLDLLVYLLKEPLEGKGIRGNGTGILNIEDSIDGVLRYSSGIEGHVTFTIAGPPGLAQSSLYLQFDHGHIRLGGREWNQIEEWCAPDQEIKLPFVTGDHYGYLNRVANRMSGGNLEVVTGKEATRVLKVIELITRDFHAYDGKLNLFEGVRK